MRAGRAVAGLWAVLFFLGGAAGAGAQGTEPFPGGGGGVRPLRLSVTDLFASGRGGGAFYTEEVFHPALRIDVFAGAIVPFEESGAAFGVATSDEDFDAGGAAGVRLQAEFAPGSLAGIEFDFADHEVDDGEVFFRGDLARLYVLFPLTQEFRLGDSPWRLGVSLAPGFQVVIPEVENSFEDRQAFLGRFIDEETFVAFTLRATVSLRAAINPFLSFVAEVSYDWAFGEADVEVTNDFGGLIERRSDDVGLSALFVFVGFEVWF